MPRIKAGIHPKQVKKTSRHQPGSARQDYSEGDLGGNEEPSGRLSDKPGGMRAWMVQHLSKVPASHRQGRRNAEKHCGGQGNRETKEERGGLDAHLPQSWHVRRTGVSDPRCRPPCNAKPGCAGRERDEERFREKLARNVQGGRSQGEPNSNFPLAGRRPRQKHSSPIRAGSKEKEKHGSKEHEHCRPGVMDQKFLQRPDPDAVPEIHGLARVRPLEAMEKDVQVCLGLTRRNSGLE
jgi:hypothetical protein